MQTVQKHLEMVRRLKKPGEKILATLTPADCDLIHMAACLPGEAAELVDTLIVVSGSPIDLKELKEEAGDWEFYLAAVLDIFNVPRHQVCTKRLDQPIHHAIELMRLGGHFWDIVKRITVYRKDPAVPDSKYDGKTLNEVARDLLVEMMQNINSLYVGVGLKRDEVLEGNYTKLADADKGRYATGAYSDAQAQERRDKAR